MTVELYIDGAKLDLTDEVVIPLTLRVAEIRNPSKRSDSFSKTVKIPGSRRNNEIFGHTYDIKTVSQTPTNGNNFQNFNRKKKADFIIFQNGSSILSGTAELRSVDNTNGNIIYNVVLFGKLVNLINTISDRELIDLDLSELEHRFDMLTLIQSWNFNEPYVYPLIDYGVVNTRMESVTMNNFRPAVKVSWYWDKIFEEAGFTYEGEFFSSSLWESLIIPYNGESIERVDTVEETTVTNTQQSVTSENTEYFLFDTIRDDEGGHYVAVNEEYVVPEDGEYTISAAYVGTLFLNPENIGNQSQDGDFAVNREIIFSVKLHVNDVETQTQTISFAEGRSRQLIEAGGFIPSEAINSLTIPVQFSNKDLTEGDTVRVSLEWTHVGATLFYNEQEGTNIPRDSFSGFSYGAYQEGGELRIITSGIEGGVLDGSLFVPSDVRQRDFITGILKVFNLYIENDKNDIRKLLVKTRDDFYDTNVFRDWSDKLDHSNTLSNTTLEDSNVRTLQLKWKNDEDDYQQQLYKRTWGRDYGEKRVDTGYEFNNEILDVLELPFSTSIPIQYLKSVLGGDTRIEVRDSHRDIVRVNGLTQLIREDPGESEPDLPRFERALIGRKILIGQQELTITDNVSPWEFQVNEDVDAYGEQTVNGVDYRVFNRSFTYIGSPDKVVPAIFKSEDAGETIEPYDSELRLLAYNGTVSCNEWTIQQTPKRFETSVRYVYNESFDKDNQYTVYPFTSHVSGSTPSNTTFDLLFDQPNQIYWSLDSGSVYPTDNLYTDYYEQTVDLLVNDDTRLVRGYFNLSASDIIKLRLSDKIWIDGVQYTINKISDYNPTGRSMTIVELVSLPNSVELTQ